MTELTPSLTTLLTDWLPRQRWFPAGKGRFTLERVGGFTLAGPSPAVELGVLLLAVRTEGRVEVVNVLLSSRGKALTSAGGGLIGRIDDGGDARWLYDGAYDPAFMAAWLELIRTRSEDAESGVQGTALAGFEDWPEFQAPLDAGVLSGEQSNTSVVVGTPNGPLIVKFFRTVASGDSPDVEISAKLTDAGSRDVPVTFGWITGYWAEPATGRRTSGHLSVVREFLEGSTDAWRIASTAALEGRDFAAEAEELGRTTGRMHRQLAAVMGTRTADEHERATFLNSLIGRIEWAWAEARSTVGTGHAQIRAVITALRALDSLPSLQRIHADYHLGQVLHAPGKGWIILDFEGEPLRPTAERSPLDVPLRDVVGMLRSFDYAGGVAINDGVDDGGDRPDRAARAHAWVARASDAFLRGYAGESGLEFNTTDPLYLGLWLDKALYEVVYELRNRPDWVDVPVQAVRTALQDVHAAPDNNATEGDVPVETTGGSGSGRTAGHSPEDHRTGAFTLPTDILAAVSEGRYHAPHAVLGAHLDDRGTVTIRTMRRLAREVTVVTANGRVPLTHEYNGIWVGTLPAERAGHVPDYRLEVDYDGTPVTQDDPYRFLPTLGEIDLHLIAEGRHETLWTALGAHVRHYTSVLGDINGVSFAVWAPNAQAVRVKADFNSWDGSLHAMRSLGGSGVWEIFVPDAAPGARYKFEILGRDGHWREKADPMARWTEVPPLTGSRVVESRYAFGDDKWMTERAARDPHDSPMSVYEVHLGSWRPGLDYRDLAEQLVEYVSWQGFTHVELMPVAEHPFGGSWGYQVTSYYAPTSRFGHPDDFKYLVDRLHQAGIGVIMDWVPAHFPKDEWALARFDGEALYEHEDPRLGEHPDWGTLIFDFGRREVRNFLVANALYWLEEFHIDGLRVDAVASMLYRDYSRKEGQWYPNVHGGRENLEAISFLQEVNATAYKRVPGIVTIAEESTAFDGVTRATSAGGLGFGIKWNMGWMHDSLEYMAEDPMHRVYHHNKITFSLIYAFTENFLLPISHDEVVHGKGSMLRKMPGDRWQQLANLRAYLAFQWAHPGKQLIFMGTEFGQESEWSESRGLDWWLTDTEPHRGLQLLVKNLNEVYRNTPALYTRDNDPAGFEWIDANDGSRNTLSFTRWDPQGNPLVCIANFAGTPHEKFQIGLPWAGRWSEVLNTDAVSFGGSGVGNMGLVTAKEGGFHGQPASALITVPPLGVLYLAPDKD